MSEIFAVKAEWGKIFADLSAEQKASLFDAMFAYHTGGDISSLDPACAMGFKFMRAFFDKFFDKIAEDYDDLPW